jgi:hypothetical protein
MRPIYEPGDILQDTKVNIFYLVEGIEDKNYNLRRLGMDATLLADILTLAYDHYIVKVA